MVLLLVKLLTPTKKSRTYGKQRASVLERHAELHNDCELKQARASLS
ncbi:hypothetical protein HDF10_000443 [Edaphobacter lichenicola]|uniref:Uncharacterized protein n=1 Tax=Tunturiibacter lichenicola TaxID=2051959 RepID=A0A7W8J4N8_9BACT|nr:hypothetical protein [Edaphobacter lichenicola]